MAERLVRHERKEGAAWLTLDSPANRNALSAALLEQLIEHLRSASADPTVRAIVLTGAGKAFCSGADLSAGSAAAAGRGEAENPFVELMKLLWDGPKPVIAAVNGPAFGGGIGLVAASDIVVAAENARFAFSEVRVGVVPAMISVVVLPKLGVHQTMRLFLTGMRFGAAEALAYGLVHRVVPAPDLEEGVLEELRAIALGGPGAVREAKQLVRTVSRLPMEEAFRYAEGKIAGLFASEEAAEGMAAFREKRDPKWSE